MKLRFLGGAGTVTGSRYPVSDEERRLLVDCGRYQGVKTLRPTAIKATEIFCHFHKEHRLNPAQCQSIDEHTVYVRKVEDSIKLDAVR